MNIKPLEPKDLAAIAPRLQGYQDDMKAYIADPNYAKAITRDGHAYSAFDDDGTILACAGLVKEWEGRAIAWSLLTSELHPYMLQITRRIKMLLALGLYRRIEAYVDVGHTEGVRWAEMLNFQREGVMKSFTPEGRDSYMYVYLRDH